MAWLACHYMRNQTHFKIYPRFRLREDEIKRGMGKLFPDEMTER